jgi:hypothetical protein
MIEFVIKDRDDPSFKKNCKDIPTRRVRRKGQIFEINGERVELFTIGTMAEALDRDVRCLLRWEAAGIWPKPLFQVSGHGKTKRWYSAIQVINCHRICWYKYRFSKGRYFDPAVFCRDIKQVFYANKLLVNTRGEVVIPKK